MSAAKYTVIKNGSTEDPTGDVVPEPCLVIRAKDCFAIRMIDRYIADTQGIVSSQMTRELVALRNEMQHWKDTNPDKMKLPD